MKPTVSTPVVPVWQRTIMFNVLDSTGRNTIMRPKVVCMRLEDGSNVPVDSGSYATAKIQSSNPDNEIFTINFALDVGDGISHYPLYVVINGYQFGMFRTVRTLIREKVYRPTDIYISSWVRIR